MILIYSDTQPYQQAGGSPYRGSGDDNIPSLSKILLFEVHLHFAQTLNRCVMVSTSEDTSDPGAEITLSPESIIKDLEGGH